MKNPLLDNPGLPAFDDIRPEFVTPAMDLLLADADAALERVVGPDVAPDFDAMSAVFTVATERLSRAWRAVEHLTGVADTPELRAAHAENLPRVTEFFTRQGADERLYAKYRAVAAGAGVADLGPVRRKALANWLRDFQLGGADLRGAQKARYAAIQERNAELSRQFSEHVLDATDGYALVVPETDLAGVPADAIAVARAAAEADGREGCKLTLHFPSYLPVMQMCRNRALRETLYTAYVTRASESGPPERDNTPVIRELLELRQEEAGLLGYRNFAELSLVPKMAGSPAEVIAFLRDLGHRARPSAAADLAELREFAAQELGITDLQGWDVPFASERLKEARYAFSDEELRQYFTLPKVLEGLFRIIETLFEVRIVTSTAPTWHESVGFYRIERSGTLVGEFYLDLYARAGKRPGAWMDDARSRWLRADSRTLQTPVAHLVCNFAAPINGRPALLTHDNVITLFHEFGHGLHHMLTQVEELGVSGISGVEWDAVELPSQFMENFCWEWDVLQQLTEHVDTGAPLARPLFDKMLAARNFQSGMQTLRQVEFALFDMLIHSEPGAAGHVQATLDAVRAEIAVLLPPAFNRFQHSFSHIFGGGYAAGYYSYTWAEVLSADAFGAFEESGVLDLDTGRRYRREILEVGGSRDALDSFKAFRGRPPSIDAMLRHLGIAA
ncbi:MAG: M3 family metallopeptidase [Pseudomonadota bacterium]|nr:M3 family metallopeptidase [Pseudomonadota bacterium]